MPEYVIPQVQVFQEFTTTPTEITNPLRAFIFGPCYQLVPYTAGATTGNELLGQYDPSPSGGYTAYSWPDIPTGGTVDESYTKLYVEDGLLRYWSESAGSGGVLNSVDNYPNRVRHATKAFKANGTSYPLSADFNDRDVQIGDVVRIFGTWAGTVYEKWTSVTGFVADTSDATVGSSVDDVNNAAGAAASVSHSQTAGKDNLVDIGSIDASSYDGSGDLGGTVETYTITVLTGSVGGSGAILQVDSASGLDDVATTSASIDSAVSIGTRGLTVTWTNAGALLVSSSSLTNADDVSRFVSFDTDDFLVGQVWTVTVNQAWTQPTLTGAGTFNSTSDTTYIVEVTEGGTSPRVTVTTTNGLDSSGPHDVTFGTAFSIGTKGVTLNISGVTKLAVGDRFYIACSGSTDTYYRTLVLADNVPYELRGHPELSSSSGQPFDKVDMNIQLHIRKDLEIPQLRTAEPNGGSSSSSVGGINNWDVFALELRVYDNIYGYDSTWVDSNGDQIGMPLVKDLLGTWSKLYLRTRYLDVLKATGVESISEIGDIETEIGTIDPDNPLAYGVWYALLNSGGSTVKYMGVASDDLAGYNAVIDKIEGRTDVYSLVPLTKDATIQASVAGHVGNVSNEIDGRWRVAFLNRDANATTALVKVGVADAPGSATTYTSDEVVATVSDDPDSTAVAYTVVDWDGGNFIEQGVVAGDLVRLNFAPVGDGTETYGEYVINSVESNQRLKLVTGPAKAITVASRFEVHASNSKAEQATAYGTVAGTFQSRRIIMLWPDQIENASNVLVDGFYACAACAGLASGVTPQQGLTNLEITGFGAVSRTTTYFSETNLNTMAGSGVWIITQDPDTGAIFTRHQVTTDPTSVQSREFSVVKNVDSISYVFLNRLKPYIGRANVTTTLLDVLRRAINSTRDFLMTSGYSSILGGQLNDATLVELRQDTVFADRVRARLELDVPIALNNIMLYLVV
jgi:hypothetical protein